MKVHNPWLGLISYKDPQKSDQNYVFCGRDNATSSIFSMVNNNLLITLYGKTGIGKTSILNAGVFPLLRSQNYFPISVRLGNIDDSNCSFARRILDLVLEELKHIGGSLKTSHPDMLETSNTAVDYLWKFFCTSTFYNKDGEEIFPVVALDQFEEVFLLQPKNAGILLQQINALIDDNREIPDEEGYEDNTNYRFIFTIREDDLCYLEDCIDTYKLPELKENRYRLSPLTDQEASEIIRLGQDYMSQDIDEIILKVLKIAKDENGHISTNILSLVCSQLFIQSEGQITLDLVSDSKRDPLESFYKKCMEQVSLKTKNYIEVNLVDDDRRKFVPIRAFEEAVDSLDIEKLMNGEYKILQDVSVGSTKCVELIHDSLARTINRIRVSEEQQAKNLKLQRNARIIKWSMYALIPVLLVSLGFVVYLILANKKFRDEKGLGIHQQFVISLSEDSLVTADNDFWKANLQVVAVNDTSKLILIDTLINKATVSNTYTFSSDTSKVFHVSVRFGENSRYQDLDTTYTIGQLTDNASVALKIKFQEAKLITYSSEVVMALDGKFKSVQDAIVIIRDKIQRTDENGAFVFNLEDSLNSDDVLYIIKKGFSSYVESDFLKKGKLKERYVISTTDTLSYFDQCCERYDTLSNWEYYTVKEHSPKGAKVVSADGQTDYIVLKARTAGRLGDGKFKIEGYYYFLSEYNALLRHHTEHHSYHLFTGWMDAKSLKTSNDLFKNYYLESYDVANGKQRISGKYWRSGRLSGEIFCQNSSLGEFGADITR